MHLCKQSFESVTQLSRRHRDTFLGGVHISGGISPGLFTHHSTSLAQCEETLAQCKTQAMAIISRHVDECTHRAQATLEHERSRLQLRSAQTRANIEQRHNDRIRANTAQSLATRSIEGFLVSADSDMEFGALAGAADEELW